MEWATKWLSCCFIYCILDMTVMSSRAMTRGTGAKIGSCGEMVVEVRLCSEAVEAVMSELSILALLLI